jgi:hypothetical protein
MTMIDTSGIHRLMAEIWDTTSYDMSTPSFLLGEHCVSVFCHVPLVKVKCTFLFMRMTFFTSFLLLVF